MVIYFSPYNGLVDQIRELSVTRCSALSSQPPRALNAPSSAEDQQLETVQSNATAAQSTNCLTE